MGFLAGGRPVLPARRVCLVRAMAGGGEAWVRAVGALAMAKMSAVVWRLPARCRYLLSKANVRSALQGPSEPLGSSTSAVIFTETKLCLAITINKSVFQPLNLFHKKYHTRNKANTASLSSSSTQNAITGPFMPSHTVAITTSRGKPCQPAFQNNARRRNPRRHPSPQA